MFNVIRMEKRDGAGIDRVVAASGFQTEKEADAAAKSEAEKFERHGFDGQNKHHWGRNETGPTFMFFTEGA